MRENIGETPSGSSGEDKERLKNAGIVAAGALAAALPTTDLAPAHAAEAGAASDSEAVFAYPGKRTFSDGSALHGYTQELIDQAQESADRANARGLSEEDLGFVKQLTPSQYEAFRIIWNAYLDVYHPSSVASLQGNTVSTASFSSLHISGTPIEQLTDLAERLIGVSQKEIDIIPAEKREQLAFKHDIEVPQKRIEDLQHAIEKLGLKKEGLSG
jgi:hypothetical protein